MAVIGQSNSAIAEGYGHLKVGAGMNRGLFTPEYTPVDIMELTLSFRFFRRMEAWPAWMNQEFCRKIF